MEPTFEVQLKIQKPAHDCFEAVVNPKHLAGYFVAAASAPLVEGTTVMWRFAEVPGEHPVQVKSITADSRIVFVWASEKGWDITVEMLFKPLDAASTMVQIRESGWRDDTKGAFGNCAGWMHMACCLKAYLEHGINLRAGGAL
jgi:uncharacterized protein YndB with AHSA1/START domain